MNIDRLRQILREGRAPERSDEYWSAFPEHIVRRLQSEGRAASLRHRLPLAALAVAAAFGLLLGFAFWHRPIPQSDAYAAFRNGRILREYESRYPGRLQAIVQDEAGVHAQVSDAADVSMSEPIWLEIREGNDRRTVATFSGQRVKCGGLNIMVLSGSGGQVMLVGDGFFWSPEASAGLAQQVQIRAGQIPGLPRRPKASTPL